HSMRENGDRCRLRIGDDVRKCRQDPGAEFAVVPSKKSRRRLLKLLPAFGIFFPDCFGRAVTIRVTVDLCEAFHRLDGKTKPSGEGRCGILRARLRTRSEEHTSELQSPDHLV